MAVPRYRQIADELRHAILEGRIKAGDRLPTEPELQEQHDVSRNTIRLALRELSAEGLIETAGRKGTFVRKLATFDFNAQADRGDRRTPGDAWAAQVTRASREPSQDFEMRIVPAPVSIAQRLRIEPDQLVCVRDCHRYIDGTPWCEEIGYYPMDLAQKCDLLHPRDIEEGCIRRLAQHGYKEVGHEDSLWVRIATPEETSAFELGTGVPMIVYDRVGWTYERPVRLTRQLLPGDRNRVHFNLGLLPDSVLNGEHTSDEATPGAAP